MGQHRLMHRLARWHVWLGWLVGVPILMWTVTGLVMVARPIEVVRGEHLRAPAAPVDPSGLALPRVSAPVDRIELVAQPRGPAWIVTAAGGGRSRYSASTGRLLPPLTPAEAVRIADSAYAGKAKFLQIAHFPADRAPLDLRRPVASWQVLYADGTRLYLEAASGEVLAVRTRWWRVFDLMWGLHIMDLEAREDTHHPVLIGFAALAVVGTLIGCVLLFRRRRARPAP